MKRRTFIKNTLLYGSALTFGKTVYASPSVKTKQKFKRIAVEEAFSIPEISSETRSLLATRPTDEPGMSLLMGSSGKSGPPPWLKKLHDLGANRIRDMDTAGISKQVLLLTAPGVQVFEKNLAVELAALANDRLAEAVRTYPDRFAGLTALAPQNPAAAAYELERGVKQLGLKGAVINSHTKGEYLDNKKYWPILEMAHTLDVPIYIHPRTPAPQMLEPYREYGLFGPMWGFAADTSLHVLRLILSGIFDRFPKLKIVIGHMGEGIPFFLFRIDNRYKTERQSTSGLKQLPSEYFRKNFVITTSGMNWQPALLFCHSTLGPDNIMFAADYPFASVKQAVSAIDNVPLSDIDKKKIYQLNAERVFAL